MNCPNCDAITRVTNLERRHDGSHRWRLCPSCNTRIRTLEVLHTPPGTVPRGEQVSSAVLTPDNVLDIRARRKSGDSVLALSDIYGVSTTTIHNIVTYKSWRHLP